MGVSFDLEYILVGSLLFFGLVLLYYFFVGSKKLSAGDQIPLLQDFARSFFPLILAIIILRSLVAEPFKIPSGSMIPTLEIGDFILVKKYAYGLRLPIINTKLLDTGKPKRGDVVVFRYPPNPALHYIKRVIGLPGDQVQFTEDKKLIINGKIAHYKAAGHYQSKNIKNSRKNEMADKLKETLPKGKPHDVILFGHTSIAGDWVVPEGHYFMMGDNRDNSSDSRSWGFVPEDNLVGKASLVWLHWNRFEGGDGFQTNRIGTEVN